MSFNKQVMSYISTFDPSSTFTKSELANEMNISSSDPRSKSLSWVLSKLAKKGVLKVTDRVIEGDNYSASNVYAISTSHIGNVKYNNSPSKSVPMVATFDFSEQEQEHEQEEIQEGVSTLNLTAELLNISERLKVLAKHEVRNDLSMYTTKELMAELETRVK